MSTTMRTAELVSHPLNRRVYGSLETDSDFLESIERFGIKEPIVYQPLSFDGGKTFQNVIVSGHRRFLAARTLKIDSVPVTLAYQDHAPIFEQADLVAVERQVIELNRQRVKTYEQAARKFNELRRIETALASDRQKSGVKNLGENFPAGRARDIAARALGMSGKTAEKISKIIEAVDLGNSVARKILDDLNADKISVDKAYREVFPQNLDHYGWAELVIEVGYKNRAKKHHPDRGGSHDEMQLTNLAHEWLKFILKKEGREKVNSEIDRLIRTGRTAGA